MTLVPRTPLIWLAGLLVVPGATVAFAGAPVVGALLVLVPVVMALLDMLVSRGALAGIRVEFPDVVRVGKGRDFEIDLTVENPSGKMGSLLMGLEIGREFETSGRTREVSLKEGLKQVSDAWPLLARVRGCYPFKTVYLEARSPFGLWARRKECPVSMEVRVYPDLREERRGLSAMFLNRGGVGTHALRQVGKGRDFEQLREYSPGDDYADIYWKATARRGFPVTKMFQIEKTQEVYVVVDHSRLSAREVDGISDDVVTTQLERFLAAALTLGQVAEQQGDLFGIVSFADRVDNFIRARNGKGHYDACRDALYNLQPSTVSPDFEELVVFLRTRLTRRALVIILTDLSETLTAEAFAEDIPLVTRQHLVMTVALKPSAARPLFTEADAGSPGDVYRDLGGQFLWDELVELQKVLGKQGVQFLLPEHDRLTSDMVTRYLGIKQRQLI